MGAFFGCQGAQEQWKGLVNNCGRRNQVDYNNQNRDNSLSAASSNQAYNPNNVQPSYGNPYQPTPLNMNQPQRLYSPTGQQQQPQMQQQFSNPYIQSPPMQQYQPAPNQIDPRLSGGNIIPPVSDARNLEGDTDDSDASHSNDENANDTDDANDTDEDKDAPEARNTPSRESVFEMHQTMAAMMQQNARPAATAMGAYGGARPMAGGYGYGQRPMAAGVGYGGAAYGSYGNVGGGYGSPRGGYSPQ